MFEPLWHDMNGQRGPNIAGKANPRLEVGEPAGFSDAPKTRLHLGLNEILSLLAAYQGVKLQRS